MGDYRQRWSIECFFQALKGRGSGTHPEGRVLEATHLTDHSRLSRFLGLISLAAVWSYLTGEWLYERESVAGRRARRAKKHGRVGRSVFQLGLTFLRRLLLPLSGHFDPGDFDHALERLVPQDIFRVSPA